MSSDFLDEEVVCAGARLVGVSAVNDFWRDVPAAHPQVRLQEETDSRLFWCKAIVGRDLDPFPSNRLFAL